MSDLDDIKDQIIDLLYKNQEELLMDNQSKFCCEKTPEKKLVYKSPLAYNLGKLLREYYDKRDNRRK